MASAPSPTGSAAPHESQSPELVSEGSGRGAAAPHGPCLFGEAVSRKVVQMMGGQAGEWFWTGTLSLICINAGIGLMIDSGLTKGFPGRRKPDQ